jgi:NADPH-dependent curcumin reductase CurA
MGTPVNRMWRVQHTVQGSPSDEDIAWHEEPVAALAAGEVLVEASFVVIDSILTALPATQGAALPCGVLGTVIESRDDKVPVGSRVSGLLGAQTHARVPGSSVFVHRDATLTDEDYLGAVSYLGATAYLAVHEVVRPQHGDTVVVTAAASAIGSLAGQLAKREGARVVGVTTSVAHGAWLVDELGFAAVIDRRSEDLGPALTRLCPDGIHGVIDGLGGTTLDACLGHLAMHARIALYSSAITGRPVGPAHFGAIVARRARVQGLSFLDYPLALTETLDTLRDLVTTKELRYRLKELTGLEHAAAALRSIRSEAETIVLRLGN